MSLPGYVPGLPGIRSTYVATHKIIFKGGVWDYVDLPLGKIIDGVNARDWTNTGNLDVLLPGTLMGKITTSGLYAPTVLGVSANAYTSGGTSITVSAASAVEIVRRIGTSGNLTYVGPPTANGTNAVTSTVAFSNVNTTTGVITVTSLGVDKVAGTLVTSTDGSGVPLSLVPDGYGIKVTDIDNLTNLSVPFAQFPVGGTIISANILPVWPSDTSIRGWIRDSLSTYGKFVMDYGY